MSASRLAALLVLGAMTGCADGDTGGPAPSDMVSSTTMVFPAGVATSPGALAQTHGIFTVPPNGGEQCCWISDEAQFRVYARTGARNVRLTVIQPAVAALGRRRQALRSVDALGRVTASRDVASGAARRIVLPLSERADAAGTALVRLRPVLSFVPSVVKTGPDMRRLSLILTDAVAQ